VPPRASRADATVWPDPSLPDGPWSDAVLIASSITAPERFGEIYERHVSEIHRYLARRVGTALADDLAAETFLVAFGSRHRYDRAAEKALPWLFGIATNLLRRHSRTERAQYRSLARIGVDPTATGTETDHADAVAAAVTASSTVRDLGGVLARLSVRERDVLLLIVWGELSYEETAAALGIPIGTVRSRLNRARRRLHAALTPASPRDDSAQSEEK
jgi:RNA polymerase sigma-70 factor (ECF subfamily)